MYMYVASRTASSVGVPESMEPTVCVPLQLGGQAAGDLHWKDPRGAGETAGLREWTTY